MLITHLLQYFTAFSLYVQTIDRHYYIYIVIYHGFSHTSSSCLLLVIFINSSIGFIKMMIPNYTVKCKIEDCDRMTLLNLTCANFILNNKIFNHNWTSLCAVNNLLNPYAT